MRKNKSLAFVLFFLFGIVSIGFLLLLFTTHYKYHFWPYHHRGNIDVTLDGETLDIDGLELSFYLDSFHYISDLKDQSLEGFECSEIKNGRFTIGGGDYGTNAFRIILPQSKFPILQSSDTIIVFGFFNTNNWHVYNYDVQISIQSSGLDASVTTNVSYSYTGEQGGKATGSFSETTNVTDSENMATCYTGP